MALVASEKGIFHKIEERRTPFVVAFFGLFVASYVFLYAVGVTPDPASKWNEEHGGSLIASATSSDAASAVGEPPVRIVIDAANIDATVSDPGTTDIDTLDQALLTGAVRYPTGVELGQAGTVLLFGHSSYLPIVHNQAYKTFDGIQNLKTGDGISVYSSSREYRYAVTGVRKANANDDSVALEADGQHLVLVTCDSFATKSDRFVVNADFVGTYSLAN